MLQKYGVQNLGFYIRMHENAKQSIFMNFIMFTLITTKNSFFQLGDLRLSPALEKKIHSKKNDMEIYFCQIFRGVFFLPVKLVLTH